MRFVAVRSLENQAVLMRHKAREMLVSQRTQLLNGLRGHLTEVGVIAPQGLRFARELAELIEACDETIPFEVCEGRCHVVCGLVAEEHDENQLLRISVPSGDHSPGDLALSPVHPELS